MRDNIRMVPSNIAAPPREHSTLAKWKGFGFTTRESEQRPKDRIPLLSLCCESLKPGHRGVRWGRNRERNGRRLQWWLSTTAPLAVAARGKQIIACQEGAHGRTVAASTGVGAHRRGSRWVCLLPGGGRRWDWLHGWWRGFWRPLPAEKREPNHGWNQDLSQLRR